jgi:hypothetical protein
MINWSRATVGVPADAGVPGGGIPYRTTIFCNVRSNIPGTNIVAMGDGVTDDTVALNTAFRLCPSNQVVFIPAGNYLCTNMLYLANNGVTIRGSGTNTVLHALMHNTSWTFLNVGGYFGGGSANMYPVISGATKGSTNIIVSSVPPSVSANNATIFLSQVNDYPYVHGVTYTTVQVPTPGGTNLQRLTGWVTGTTPTSISFWPPLPFDLTNSQVYYWDYNGGGCRFSGIEDLKIQADTNDNFNIYFERCFGCWARNVECAMVSEAHIYCRHSACGEIRDCFTHDFYGAGGGNNGEGIELYSDCTGYLIENNIIYHCFPGINTSGSSSGNVVAYNYGYDAHSGSTIIGNNDDANHGYHNVMNLWEGNVGAMFQSDGFYGSASHITVYRSYYSGTHPEGLTYHRICVDLAHWSDYFNVVGCVLGSPGWNNAPPGLPAGIYATTNNNYNYQLPCIYRFGFPSMGNNGYTSASTNPPTVNLNDLDFFVQPSTILADNFDYNNNAIVTPVNNLPPSLFYTNMPSWWTNGLTTNIPPWPPIDPANPSQTTIPAQLRFASYNYPPPTNIYGNSSTQTASQAQQSTSHQIASPPCFQVSANSAPLAYCPANDPAVVEWLRADGGLNFVGSNVVTWVADIGVDAAQGTPVDAPVEVLNAKNGLPALSFNGTSSFLQTAAFPAAIQQPYTIFVVYNWQASSAVPGFVYDGIDNNRAALFNNNGYFPANEVCVYYGAGSGTPTGLTTNSTWNIAEFQVNGAASTVSINGSAQTLIPNAQGTSPLDGVTLGARYNGTEWANVQIGEFIIVQGLATSTQSSINSYLRRRWATY